MTQEQINIERQRVDNLRVNYYTRHYKNSPYQSLGQILGFIYVYCGFNVMESCTAGSEGVFLYGSKIADISWDEEKKIPTFSFIESKWYSQHYAEDNQGLVLSNWEEIIKPF